MAERITIVSAIPAVGSAGLEITLLATPPWTNSQVVSMSYVLSDPVVDSGIQLLVTVAESAPLLSAGVLVGDNSDMAALFAGGACLVMTPTAGPAPVLGQPLVDPVAFGDSIFWSAVTGSGSTIPAGVMTLELEEIPS